MENLKNKIGLPPQLRDMMLPNQPDSVAVDVAGVVADFNALLTKLKDAGFMKAD